MRRAWKLSYLLELHFLQDSPSRVKLAATAPNMLVEPRTCEPQLYHHCARQSLGMVRVLSLFSVDAAGKATTNAEALSALSKIEGRVAVLAVCGLYRSGKSFLLNQLYKNLSTIGVEQREGAAEEKTVVIEKEGAGAEGKGFEVGNTINACTSGIWILVSPVLYSRPTKNDRTRERSSPLLLTVRVGGPCQAPGAQTGSRRDGRGLRRPDGLRGFWLHGPQRRTSPPPPHPPPSPPL